MSGSEGHVEDEGTLQQEEILKHECQICGEKFSTLQQLQNHQVSHSEEPLHLCHKCGETFETFTGLSRHLETHLEDQPHSCHICNKTFQFPMDLKQHMETHTDRKSHECAICSHRFRTERYLKVHTEKCHGTNPTTHLEYQSGTELQEHTDRIHPEGTFECSDCGKRFNTPVGLNDHFIRTHIQCEENVQTVKSYEEGDSNINLKTVLEPSLSSVECSICFKTYSTFSDLESHNRYEHGESDEAAKESTSASRKDMDSACEERFPFECRTCYLGFATMEELKAHNEERHPATCTKCGATFTRLSDLNRHIRHKQCKADQYVGTDSSESSGSEEDTASEQEEKLSHVCPTCKMGYSSLQELNAHCEKMHPVKVIECPKCGDKFVRKADVNRHIRQGMCKAQEGTDQSVQIVQEGTAQNVQEENGQNVQNVQEGKRKRDDDREEDDEPERKKSTKLEMSR